jgi:hypothetical protein
MDKTGNVRLDDLDMPDDVGAVTFEAAVQKGGPRGPPLPPIIGRRISTVD